MQYDCSCYLELMQIFAINFAESSVSDMPMLDYGRGKGLEKFDNSLVVIGSACYGVFN